MDNKISVFYENKGGQNKIEIKIPFFFPKKVGPVKTGTISVCRSSRGAVVEEVFASFT